MELRAAAERHADEHDVYHQCHTFAVTADKRVQKLEPLARPLRRTAELEDAPSERGSDELLEDLRALYLRAQESGDHLGHGRAGGQSRARRKSCCRSRPSATTETEAQAKWFMTRIKTGAPQALVVG